MVNLWMGRRQGTLYPEWIPVHRSSSGPLIYYTEPLPSFEQSCSFLPEAANNLPAPRTHTTPPQAPSQLCPQRLHIPKVTRQEEDFQLSRERPRQDAGPKDRWLLFPECLDSCQHKPRQTPVSPWLWEKHTQTINHTDHHERNPMMILIGDKKMM